MKTTIRKALLLFAVLAYSVTLSAKERSAMIGEGIAIFYPDNFQAKRHLPSFALNEEPKELRKLDKNFPVKVHFSKIAGKSLAYVNIKESTDLYGTGEAIGDLHRNGKNIKLWNTDNYSYGKDKGIRLYKSHPWVLAVREDGTAFGVLADNTWEQEISLVSGIQFTSTGPAFRVIVIEKDSPQEVVKVLADLTGKMEMPPLWSLGFQQSRYSYYPDTVVENLADTYRKKQIPIDVIWMDIDYMDKFKVFTFSPKDFPSPKKLNKYLHDRDFKAVYMIDPGVKKEDGYFVYDSGTKEDVWVKDANGKNYVGNVWPGACVFPDYTIERTQKWWANLYKDFMATGIDGVWNDMNDPAVFDGPRGSMPKSNIHRGGEQYPEDIHTR
jgi:alpha-glucosidase